MTEPRQKPLDTRIVARTRTSDEIPHPPRVKGEGMTKEYRCEHGISSGLPFIHELGPTTSAGSGDIVPVCHPELIEIED